MVTKRSYNFVNILGVVLVNVMNVVFLCYTQIAIATLYEYQCT